MNGSIPPAGSGGFQPSGHQPHLPPPRNGTSPIVIIIVAIVGGIFLIGILSAIAIPSFINQRQKAESKRIAASDVAVIAGRPWITNTNGGDVLPVLDGKPGSKGVPVGSQPIDMTSGFDSLWVAGSGSGNVVRLPYGDVRPARVQIQAGKNPFGIAVGFGQVWTTDVGAGKVVRVDPRTNQVSARIPVGDEPRGIAAGRNAIWVANARSGTVSRIDDPRSPRPSSKQLPAGGSFCHDLTVGDGRVWIASPPSRSVLTLDERTGKLLGRPIRLSDAPISIEAAKGSVFVAGEDGTVFRIDSRTREVTGEVQVGGALSDLTVDGDSILVLDRTGRLTRLSHSDFIATPIGDAA